MTTAPILVQIIAPNRLVRSGLRLLVESGPGMTVVGEAEGIRDAGALRRAAPPDVIVVDMDHEPPGAIAELRALHVRSRIIVLACADAGGPSMLPEGVAGVVDARLAERSLIGAIHTVHRGGSWPAGILTSEPHGI